jgi:predicted amidophosphoribosyltransferase
MVVRAGYHHDGAARRLVHRLKYQGVAAAAVPLARRLADVVAEAGDRPGALVPVPRAIIRRGRHGIDPAVVLAGELGRLLAVPVLHALRPGCWWPRHAGKGRGRLAPRLSRSGVAVPPGSALVDDVVTTGVTLEQALGLIASARFAYAATSGGARRAEGDIGPFTAVGR